MTLAPNFRRSIVVTIAIVALIALSVISSFAFPGLITSAYSKNESFAENGNEVSSAAPSPLLNNPLAAGPPSKVIFYFGNPAMPSATDYLGNKTVVAGTLFAQSNPVGTSEISFALTDAYGNPIGFGAVSQIVLTVYGGEFDQAGTLRSTLIGSAGGSGAGHFSITGAPSPMTLSFIPSTTYVQNSSYGAVGELSANVTLGGVQFNGSSGPIITSALGALASVVTFPTGTVKAGTSIMVEDFVNTGIANYYQSGVPITLNLCTSPCATTPYYDGKFTTGTSSITLTTNSTGGVEAAMPANTTVGDVAFFNSTAPDPINTSPINKLAGATSAPVTTISSVPQYLVSVVASPTTGGSTTPTGGQYYNSGSTISIVAKPLPGYIFHNWVSSSASITISSSKKLSTTANINGPGSITANFVPSVKLSFNLKTLSVVHGHTTATTATIRGATQLVALSVSGLPAGATYSWASGSLLDSVTGVTDKLTINTGLTTPPGSYTITVVATGADGQKSTAKITLTVS